MPMPRAPLGVNGCRLPRPTLHLHHSSLNNRPSLTTQMSPKAPPIDAEKFLDDSRKDELDQLPHPLRHVGAWLLLISGDERGEWEHRPIKCIECPGQRLPCIDRVNPGTKRRHCEGCSLGDLRCAPGYQMPGVDDTAPGSRATSQARKRKLEESEDFTATKLERLSEESRASSEEPGLTSEGSSLSSAESSLAFGDSRFSSYSPSPLHEQEHPVVDKASLGEGHSLNEPSGGDETSEVKVSPNPSSPAGDLQHSWSPHGRRRRDGSKRQRREEPR